MTIRLADFDLEKVKVICTCPDKSAKIMYDNGTGPRPLEILFPDLKSTSKGIHHFLSTKAVKGEPVPRYINILEADSEIHNQMKKINDLYNRVEELVNSEIRSFTKLRVKKFSNSKWTREFVYLPEKIDPNDPHLTQEEKEAITRNGNRDPNPMIIVKLAHKKLENGTLIETKIFKRKYPGQPREILCEYPWLELEKMTVTASTIMNFSRISFTDDIMYIVPRASAMSVLTVSDPSSGYDKFASMDVVRKEDDDPECFTNEKSETNKLDTFDEVSVTASYSPDLN